MDYGALALIPPFVVIVLAIIMRTSFEPLLIGCLTGFVIISFHDKSNFFTGLCQFSHECDRRSAVRVVQSG